MKKLILLGLSVFLLSGCSYSELNNLAVVSALGIDYSNNEFKLTAQVMDIKSSNEGSTTASTLIYESSGKTIAKAIRNFSVRYPKNVYLGHLEFIVIDKEAASRINDIFDYIMRSPEVRSSSYVLFCENETANKILKPDNEVKDRFPVESLKTVLLDSKDRNGTIYDLTLEDFLSTYLKKGIDPVVPLVKTTNKKGMTATSVIIDNMAAFKNKNLLESFSSDDAIAYNTINNNYHDIVIDGKYKNNVFGAVIYNPKTSVDLKIKDNNIFVNIDISIDSKVIEISDKINLTDKKIQNAIKKEINKELKSYIYSLIDYSKKNNTETLGLKNTIYKNYYHDYSKFKNKNIYDEAKFTIKITNNMYRFGNINKGA